MKTTPDNSATAVAQQQACSGLLDAAGTIECGGSIDAHKMQCGQDKRGYYWCKHLRCYTSSWCDTCPNSKALRAANNRPNGLGAAGAQSQGAYLGAAIQQPFDSQNAKAHPPTP